MTSKRMIEVFSDGCYLCQRAIRLVETLTGDSSDIKVLDMRDAEIAAGADRCGVERLPAIAIDGKLTDCTIRMTKKDLRAASVGRPSTKQLGNAKAGSAGRTG